MIDTDTIREVKATIRTINGALPGRRRFSIREIGDCYYQLRLGRIEITRGDENDIRDRVNQIAREYGLQW